MESVAAFTDTYLPTVNGVTYSLATLRDRWHDRGGRMDIVYPDSDAYEPKPGEAPVRSLPFPFYDGYRLGLPTIPEAVTDVDIVHVHTPFSVGVAGLRLARGAGLPVIASYHTPAGEYTDYLAPIKRIAGGLSRVSVGWERRFLDKVDLVTVPSESTNRYLRERVGVSKPVHTLANGVDIDQFRPTDPTPFIDRYSLATGRPIVGYTGRHGHEKRLHELVEAAAGLDVTVVFGGDGPARETLERQAALVDIDARFLGFLPREELPAFYSALDVFAFPSPVETQGLVALEAMACGTPVVGAASGALEETIDDGVTGYHFESGNLVDFRGQIVRAIETAERLGEACLASRDSISVERTVARLEELYEAV